MVRYGRSEQEQEAAYSRRYVGSVTARHRSFCRHSGPRWRHRIAGDAVRSVSIPREAVCRQCLSRADFWQRARQNPPLSRNRNHPTIRSSERVRAATQALDCRTHLAWLNRCRRLAKDWENLNRNALAFLKLASIRLMLRKLCNP